MLWQVSIGVHECVIVSHTPPTSVVCQLPEVGADVGDVMVTVRSLGMASGSFRHTFPLAVTGPPSFTNGSVGGGLLLTLPGRGFKNTTSTMAVSFGGTSAVIVGGSSTMLQVLTPAYPSAASVAATTSIVLTTRSGNSSPAACHPLCLTPACHLALLRGRVLPCPWLPSGIRAKACDCLRGV